jgi:dUTP pyrophosphatase
VNASVAPQSVTVAVKRLAHADGLPMPSYQTEGAAGMDLLAAIDAPVTLAPLERALVSTGLVLALPQGFEAQVRPRSGLALTHGLTVLNAPGTIDSDYRGEVSVLLVNLGQNAVTVTRGMRIAQLVVAVAARATIVATDELDATRRGRGGYGSTGV